MNRKSQAGRTAGYLTAALVGVSVITGCEVTNPGPVDDAFLTLPASQQGMVTGARERLNRAVGYVVYSTALVSREIFPGGQTGSYGHTVAEQAGNHAWGAAGPNGIYNNAHQARWIAEEALRRFTEVGNVSPALMAEAHIWAGYANRVLGENWCVGVIDGGPPAYAITNAGAVDQAGWDFYFKRAEDHFTKAIALAPNDNLKNAAIAGRAQVRVWLKDWAGATADAGQIQDSYTFVIDMDITTNANVEQRNHLYFASSSSPYRSYTVRFTYADTYYTESRDPRVKWEDYALASDRLCVGSLQGYAGGRVPCTRQRKYVSEDDDIRLASGREMRLIEAEALLVAGNWQAARDKINALRATIRRDDTNVPLQPWTANSLNETWTILKRERGIELWLEGRRMGDQRRWQPTLAADGVTPLGPGTPGDLELPNFQARSTVFTLNPRGREIVSGQPSPRALCYNVSAAERNSNPNFAEDSEGG